MIAADFLGANKPSLNEALGWIGSRVDDIHGENVGKLEDVWIDPGTGAPRWLLVKDGRIGGRSTLIPFEDATAAAEQVWVPYEREVVRNAPTVDASAPLTQQVEARLRAHYAASASSAAVPHSSVPTPDDADAASDRPATGEPGPPELAAAEPPQARPAEEPPQAPASQGPRGADSPRGGGTVPGYERWAAAEQRSGDPGSEGSEASTREPADRESAAPAIEAIDRAGEGSHRVEIELEGGLRISGRISGLRITPIEDGSD